MSRDSPNHAFLPDVAERQRLEHAREQRRHARQSAWRAQGAGSRLSPSPAIAQAVERQASPRSATYRTRPSRHVSLRGAAAVIAALQLSAGAIGYWVVSEQDQALAADQRTTRASLTQTQSELSATRHQLAIESALANRGAAKHAAAIAESRKAAAKRAAEKKAAAKKAAAAKAAAATATSGTATEAAGTTSGSGTSTTGASSATTSTPSYTSSTTGAGTGSTSSGSTTSTSSSPSAGSSTASSSSPSTSSSSTTSGGSSTSSSASSSPTAVTTKQS
jgi:hypothetical protein